MRNAWYTTAILASLYDDGYDFANVGGTPAEERDDEGMEAPVRETRHGIRGEWSRDFAI